ncbi:hypothetical protein M0Q50_01820 [bacterium]|jgi:hypothetical protein|nr:hypothetical protein [bacterium]
MKNKIDTQKYPIDTIFESDDICFRVVDYEKTLSDDGDDHYEVCFDEEYNCKVWTKQSCLDKMKLK